MSAADLIRFVLRWGVTGSLLLAAYLIIAWQTAFFGLLRSILMYVAIMVVADMQDLAPGFTRPTFSSLLAYNYTLYIFWLLFDTLVIDILLVAVWHPGFLKLPSREPHGSVSYHLRTIPRGLILGMPVTLVGTGIALLLLR